MQIYKEGQEKSLKDFKQGSNHITIRDIIIITNHSTNGSAVLGTVHISFHKFSYTTLELRLIFVAIIINEKIASNRLVRPCSLFSFIMFLTSCPQNN